MVSAMGIPLFVFATLMTCEIALGDGGESNILRLAIPRKIAAIQVETLNVTETLDEEIEGKTRNARLGTFSKNNPEQDWKKHLKKLGQGEERPRMYDLDFMKEKLEITGNSVRWLVDIYDPLKWSKVPGELGPDCRRDMEMFLKELNDGELWAAKSEFLSDPVFPL